MKTRNLLLSLLVFSSPLKLLLASDFTESAITLADAFASYISNNEGTTSFRSLNIPSGGKSESMGTACVALTDDISFFDYNPAASAVLEQTEIAVFHNAWIADSALETISATTRAHNLGTGIQVKCFYVPFTEYDGYGERANSSYYSETALTFNIGYNFLAGYKFRGIAVGANVKAAWRSIPDYADSSGTVASGSGLAQSALALMGDVGILLRWNAAKFYTDRKPNMSFGLTLANAGAALTGFGSAVTLDDPLPSRISAGFAYRPLAALLITSEFRQPINLQSLSEYSQWAASLGFEATITPFFTFLGGLLLQGASPRISMGSGFTVKGIIMNVNYTFDITSSLNPINHISLSAKIQLGDQGRAVRQQNVDAHYIRGLELYAEGTRSAIELAIREWQEALALDKRFDPAKEALKAANDMLSAHDSITSLGKLQPKSSE